MFVTSLDRAICYNKNSFLFSPMASLFNSSMQEREHSCMHDHVVTEHGKALHALYITKGNSKETKGENQQL